jgi:DNA-directed RNA polymerase specialized sigma24 family protein
MDSNPAESFTRFVMDVGPRIQHGLMAAFGPEVGAEATSEALVVAWQDWQRISAMNNPAGYVYTVGRNKGRRFHPKPVFPDSPDTRVSEPWVEPGLPDALTQLTERQRVVTILLHGGDWTASEVAELLGIDRGTVQKHADRAMVKLRAALEVTLDA